MLTPRAQKPDLAGQQYAVVLVNEDQLNQLMRRPGMRQVNSRFASNDALAYQKLKRRMTAAVIVLVVLATAGLTWVYLPQPAMASVFDWSRPAALPTIYTGASFSVTIASLDSADGANDAAARVRTLGMPAFTRRSPGKYPVYQAMVGPFASLDEAEKAQRRLGGMGYRGARLFVDESLRSAPHSERPLDTPKDLGLLLLGAPDRLSLVFELQSEPRQVTSSRPDAATLQIDAGPMPTPSQPQQWSAPDGVHLLHTVAIETVAAQGGLNYIRARVALPEFAKANIRTEGRRVYVDLTWPLDEEQDPRTPRRPAASASLTAPASQEANSSAPAKERVAAAGAQKQNSQAQQERYKEEIQPLHRRIAEMRPFILSAAQSGSTDVYAALDATLATLETSLVAISVPPSEAGQHQLLIAATRSARSGLQPGFTGDRLAHAQKALTMFDGAMAAPVISTAP